MTTANPLTASPQAVARTEATVAYDLALRAPSFLDFVRELRIHGIEFTLRGKNPLLQLGVHRFRLRTLGSLPDLRDAFVRWERLHVTFQFNDLEAKALQLRLHWMASTDYRHDLPGETSSLMHFAYKLGVDGVADAMSIAFAKPGIADDNQRFLYFCGVCHHSIRANGMAQPLPAKEAHRRFEPNGFGASDSVGHAGRRCPPGSWSRQTASVRSQ